MSPGLRQLHLPSVHRLPEAVISLSWTNDNYLLVLDSCVILANVSMIARVAWTACGFLIIVASIYSPFSGKALGSFALPPLIEVKNFDFNPAFTLI